MNRQARTGRRQMPTVFQLHWHKRGYMKYLLAAAVQGAIHASSAVSGKHIAVLFTPRRVVNFSHHALNRGVSTIKTVVETDWIETVAKVAKMCQQADGPGGTMPGAVLHQIPHGPVKWYLGIAQVITAPKARQCGATRGPKPSPSKHGIEFGEVQIYIEQPIAKRVGSWRQTPMLKPPVIDRAVHGHPV